MCILVFKNFRTWHPRTPDRGWGGRGKGGEKHSLQTGGGEGLLPGCWGDGALITTVVVNVPTIPVANLSVQVQHIYSLIRRLCRHKCKQHNCNAETLKLSRNQLVVIVENSTTCVIDVLPKLQVSHSPWKTAPNCCNAMTFNSQTMLHSADKQHNCSCLAIINK